MIARLAWPDWERLARIGNVASKDQARPILTGVHFEGDEGRLRAVATDSYKLATVAVDAELDEAGPILLPARQVTIATSALRQLARAQLGSKFAVTHETEIDLVDPPGEDPEIFLELNCGDRYVGSLTIDQILAEGKIWFPAYRKLLHKPSQSPLSRSTLARKRKDEIAHYITVQYGRTYDPEQSSKETLLNIVDEFAAEPISRAVGLNQDHLNDLMRTTTTRYPEYLKIEMFGETRPVFFSNPADKDWLGIQMPVRT